MPAGIANFLVEQGATFSKTLTVKEGSSAYDLTGYLLRGQIRQAIESESILASFSFSSIGSDSAFTMSLSATITEKLPPGTAYYDVELYRPSDGFVIRLLQGRVEIDQGVTR